ncbi:MAG TPA: DUF1206 domain-containing protein [Euzebya sp.]|nr:DUF1206 domain-containing protein [Euzebya sp.]
MTAAQQHMQNAKDGFADAADTLDDAAAHPAVERMAELGFAARGVLFVTIGAIAASVGVTTSEDADTAGAINQLSEHTFGTIILVTLAVGLAGYSLLRLLHVVVNPSDEDGVKGLFRRAGYLAQSLVYGGLTVFTVRTLMGDGGGGGASEEQATQQALELPLGAWLVGAAAVVLAVVAISQLVRAVRRDFMDQAARTGNRRTVMAWTGTIGHAARGVLFGTIAWLLAQAALTSDSSEAGGTDAAIQELALSTGGTFLLLAVALGVVAYGLWCLAMAAWGDPRHAE